VIRHESPGGTVTHHQECHAEWHTSWQGGEHQAMHRRRECGLHKALIVLRHFDGGIVQDDTEVRLSVLLSAPADFSENNLEIAPQAGLEPATLRLTEAMPERYQVKRRPTKAMRINELVAIGADAIDRGR